MDAKKDQLELAREYRKWYSSQGYDPQSVAFECPEA